MNTETSSRLPEAGFVEWQGQVPSEREPERVLLKEMGPTSETGRFLSVGLLNLIEWTLSLGSLAVSCAMMKEKLGAKVCVCLLVMIAAHEAGHWVSARCFSVRARLPVFVPFLGAFVGMFGKFRSRVDEAWASLAGPAAGMFCSLLIHVLGAYLKDVDVLFTAQACYWINLLNLIPCGVLDGARVFAPLFRWAPVAGLACFSWLFFSGRIGVVDVGIISRAMPICVMLVGIFQCVAAFLGRPHGPEPRPLWKGETALWACLVLVVAVGAVGLLVMEESLGEVIWPLVERELKGNGALRRQLLLPGS